MVLSLSNVVSNIGDYTLDCILITKAEPLHPPVGPEIVWCNKAFTDMTGYDISEIIGKTPRILQGDMTDKDELARLGKKLRNWEACNVDLYNYKKDGAGFWVELSIFPVKDENGWFRYWVSVQRDITERKKRELDLAEANAKINEYQKDLEAFSFAAFHDLRSPLRIVDSMMDIIIEDGEISGLSDEAKRLFDSIHKRIGRMRALVQNMSKYAVDKQMGSDPSSMIMLRPWLSEIFEDLNPLGNHKLHVHAKMDYIFAPKTELGAIFLNLFDNSVKHNNNQNLNVHVYVELFDEDLIIFFDDDGAGVPFENREKIFSRFTKTETSTLSEGDGFGLSFIRQLTLRNGGNVHVEDSPHGGARFVIKWRVGVN